MIAIDVWDGNPAQVSIFTINSGWTHPVLMLGGQAGILSDYNCGYDYVFVIGGDGIIKWRGVPTNSTLAGAVSDAIGELATSAAPEGVVARHKLLQGYPNPFNPMTNIPFELADSQGQVAVQLDILDIRGRVVRTLVDGFRSGGQRYVSTWDGTDQTGRKMPSGTYMSRLRIQGLEPQARLLTLVK